MDENKLEELKKINYKVLRCCGLCSFFVHGSIQTSIFGICSNNSYNHIKHNQIRKLSVSIFGGCEKFQLSKYMEKKLESFSRFLQEV